MPKYSKEKSSEWVGARVIESHCERIEDSMKQTVTPSARELRSIARNKLREKQAIADENSVTAYVIIPELNPSLASDVNIDISQAQVPCTRKLPSNSVFQPDQPHRAVSASNVKQLPPSLESGLNTEQNTAPDFPLRHQKRDSNIFTAEKKMKPKINFPNSNNKIWESIDKELQVLLPSIFPDHKINKLSTTELSEQLDSWLYNFFIDRFGQKLPTSQKFLRPQRKNKALESFRKRKNELKAARKALLRAGLKGTPEEERISKEWFATVRQHNKLRVALKKKDASQAKLSAEQAFKRDPNKFAAKIFNQNSSSGLPEFSADEAHEYFTKTYRDTERNFAYSALPDFQRPASPEFLFSLRCPSLSEIEKSVRRKRNGASPGLNCLTYVPYKKCSSLRQYIFKLGKRIWQSQDIPKDWAEAFIILLFKAGQLSNVADFRPIAITSVTGKIFFSVLADRLQFFMVKNNFISKSIQKGFLAGVSGCLEHSFALMEALKEARTVHRQIVVTWIDLANAYGSVRHNLIQFALNWYHVPLLIQKIIFDYYEKLCAMVITQKWSTGFFLFDIGLFQGCVLSTILFDCVFQLLIDFLKPLQPLGYSFKAAPSVTSLVKAYADDLTLVTHNMSDNQNAIDKTKLWLEW